MAKNYDKVDLYFTHRGDYVISAEGDLYDTSDDPLRSQIQEMRTRIQSDIKDWRLYPEIGATLSSLIGEPNNKLTAETIKAKITASLSQYGLIDTRDLDIKYMPIDSHRILFRLKLKVSPTIANYNSESITLQIIYNYSDNNLHLL